MAIQHRPIRSGCIVFASLLTASLFAADKEWKAVALPGVDGIERHASYRPGKQKSPAVLVRDDLSAIAIKNDPNSVYMWMTGGSIALTVEPGAELLQTVPIEPLHEARSSAHHSA